MTTLYDLTRHTHHDAEATAFGGLYSAGTVSREAYADWLRMQFMVHELIDPYLPGCLRRAPALLMDLSELGVGGASCSETKAMSDLEAEIVVGDALVGTLAAAYVFSGAHLRGGAVIRPRLEEAGLPCHHLHFDDPAGGRAYLRWLRDQTHLADAVNRVFSAVVRVMDDIYERHYEDSEDRAAVQSG